MSVQLYIAYLFFASMSAIVLAPAMSKLVESKRFCLVLSVIAFIMIVALSIYVVASGVYVNIAGGIGLSPFACFFTMVFAACMCMVETTAYLHSSHYAEFAFLAGISFIAMIFIATATSLLPMLIGLEMVSVSTAIMILFEGRQRIEAAVKFFVVSSLSVGLFAFAIALLLPYNPGLSLSSLVSSTSSGYLVFLSIGLFIVALGFEGAIFPFNLWIPDVYVGAPTFVTSIMAGLNKKVALLVLIEMLFIVFIAYTAKFSLVLQVLAILTMFFGNLLALTQTEVKRMFAYSSISQAGYILVGIATGTQAGLTAALFYIFAHAIMIIGAFSIVLFLESHNAKSVDDYTALYSRNSFLAISLTLIMLSMAGIPPLIGFMGKFLLFSSALSAGMPVLAIVGVITSLISIYYYSRVINVMFSRKKSGQLIADPYIFAVLCCILAIIVLLGIYPQPLIYLALHAIGSIRYI